MPLDLTAIRRHFPALHEQFNGKPAIFFDNPGGTQVPHVVISAMTDYLTRRNANGGGAFATSQRTDVTVAEARQAAADFLNATPDEIIFGNNMTSLAFQLSRTMVGEFGPGDEIIVTRLDHDANIQPWLLLAEDSGATLRWANIDVGRCTLDMGHMATLISQRTKLIAVGYSSNAVGTINDLQTIIGWAKAAGAFTFIDAVQHAPHALLDVQALDCDFLACSAYKFFGPHVGILYGKRAHLNILRKYQVAPAADTAPARWETGTKNHEGLAGVTAAIDYLASLGVNHGTATMRDQRRAKLTAAWPLIAQHERMLTTHLIVGLQAIPGVRLYGLTAPTVMDKRVATVALRKQGTTPRQMAERLAAENINVWSGNFYALRLTERLGVEPSGGLLRIGLVHYNTAEEVERCLEVIERS